MQKILVTGGLGFIGTNFILYWRDAHPADTIIVIDAMTYAANEFLARKKFRNVIIEYGDIRDQSAVNRVLEKHRPDHCFHFAAESHVCRSLSGPKDFVTSNIVGTFNLLEEWKRAYACDPDHRLIAISTDEVFGELDDFDLPWTESSPLLPRSPYAASKASADLLCRAYHESYALPVVITNCSNNYGPFQHVEKLIPATIHRLINGKAAVLYGSGQQKREWIHVYDHVRALDFVLRRGVIGERYLIGSNINLSNFIVVDNIYHSLIKIGVKNIKSLVIDNDFEARPTDDRRYALSDAKIKALGWEPVIAWSEGLLATCRWYVANFQH